ncbi:trace amine-associated receptor 7h-like [Acropora muricata]|uniref:trace amine-associated receptor 7h-like n=1 Tax=Acropora muricata TaxID=159855 RepID=UPI0034E5FC1D
MDWNEWNPFWATCFSVMAFLIIVGNSLTITTLLGKKFRQRPQFLLISLAFADLLVGCATTLYVIVQCGFFALWFVFNIFDMFVGLSSIFHLAVISLERLHATLRPFRHRQLSLKAYWVAIATPWILSLCLGISVSILARFKLIMQQKVLILLIICLITPLLITCFSYLVIWGKRRKITVRSFRRNQEARFTRTIFLVTAASFITWMPFLYHNIAARVWPDLILWSAFFIIKLLHYSNSFVNFVIYILRFPSYRKALFSLCRLHCVL